MQPRHMDKPKIQNIVEPGQIIYWAHYADHCDFSPAQRQSARHLRESMFRLLRYRDKLDAIREAFNVSSLIGIPRPDGTQQHQLFDATQDFFQTYYATLSAWASFLARVYGKLRPDTAPTGSMKQFIEWLQSADSNAITPFMAQELEDARRYRTILDHSGQSQPFDWGVHDGGMAHPTVFIVLFGPKNRSGGVPLGSISGGPLGDDGWHFIAPDEVSVTNGLALLYGRFMPILVGMNPLDDDVPVTCPDFVVERAWRKGKAPYAELLSPYLPAGPLVNLELPVAVRPSIRTCTNSTDAEELCSECKVPMTQLGSNEHLRRFCLGCGLMSF